MGCLGGRDNNNNNRRRRAVAPGRAHNRPGAAAGAVRGDRGRGEAILDLVARQAVAAGVIDAPSAVRGRPSEQPCDPLNIYSEEIKEELKRKRLNMIHNHAEKNPGVRSTFTQLGFRLFMLPRDPIFMRNDKSQCIHNSIFRINKNFDHRLKYGDNGECCPQSAHFFKNEKFQGENNVFYGISKSDTQSFKAIKFLIFDAWMFALKGKKRGVLTPKDDNTVCILFHFTKNEPLHIWICGKNTDCIRQAIGIERRNKTEDQFVNSKIQTIVEALHQKNKDDENEHAEHLYKEYKLVLTVNVNAIENVNNSIYQENSITVNGVYMIPRAP